MDYKKMYLVLFDATAKAIDLLVEAHQEAERLCIEHDNTPIELIGHIETPHPVD